MFPQLQARAVQNALDLLRIRQQISRMIGKCEHRGFQATVLRTFHGLTDQLLMTQMHSIEVSERDCSRLDPFYFF